MPEESEGATPGGAPPAAGPGGGDGGDGRLQGLLDREAIRDVLFRYCRGVDRCDEALLRSAYHDDAVDDHVGFTGPASEFVDFVLAALREQFTVTQHVLGNILVDLDGDVAHTESQFMATHVRPPRDGEQEIFTLGGRYLDRLERRGGRWAIAHRLQVSDWVDVRPLAAAPYPVEGGSRTADDPSYRYVPGPDRRP